MTPSRVFAACASMLVIVGFALAAGPGQKKEYRAPLALPVRQSDAAGSLPVGRVAEPVPQGSVVVAPDGNDAGVGSMTAPFRTIAYALRFVPLAGTVVLRAGVYHESVVVTRPVTIQNYPGESAWLDGSIPLTAWMSDGDDWVAKGWSARFDSSPTYTKGAPDGHTRGWTFVDPAHAMAAHPDEVFVDGVAQRQVSTRQQVGPGNFFLDEKHSRIYLGSSPVGHHVRATDLARAISVRAPHVRLRGFGVRRYGTSVWQMGAITLERPFAQVSDVEIDDSATTGLSATSTHILLRNVTVQRSGMLGIHASHADSLALEGVRIDGNNTERFNMAPVAGGIKIGRTHHVAIRDSVVAANAGNGLWIDESSVDVQAIGNNIENNVASGISFELSDQVVAFDNLIMGNGRDGIKVNDTSHVAIWNNTIVKNARAVNIVQDDRSPTSSLLGHAYTWSDQELTWEVSSVTVANNVLGLSSKEANCVLCVEDYTHKRTADQMSVVSDGNVYNRAGSARPAWLVVWSDGTRAPVVFPTLRKFQSGTGQERHAAVYDSGEIVDLKGSLAPSVAADSPTVARPLPAFGFSRGNAPHLGVWGR